MGTKQSVGAEKTPKLTSSRRNLLREASWTGRWTPRVAGDFRMVRRLAADGFGTWDAAARVFTINDAGRAAVAKAGA